MSLIVVESSQSSRVTFPLIVDDVNHEIHVPPPVLRRQRVHRPVAARDPYMYRSPREEE